MKNVTTSLRMWLGTLVVCCMLYPGVLYLFGQVVVPDKAEGSIVRAEDGTIIGSELIAQNFTQPEYLWPRPSPVDYDASATGGSNLSPTSPKITERAEAIIATYLNHGMTDGEHIPSELVTGSGSGMDPHVSRKAARFQADRIAEARKVPVDSVYAVIDDHAASPSGLGSYRIVNVLKTNLTLDDRFPTGGGTTASTATP